VRTVDLRAGQSSPASDPVDGVEQDESDNEQSGEGHEGCIGEVGECFKRAHLVASRRVRRDELGELNGRNPARALPQGNARQPAV
jgi:hypothetical protein